MLMKKVFGIVLSLILVLSLMSCSTGSHEEATESTTPAISYFISAVCDNTVVSAGDEIEVKIHIEDIPFTACFDIYVAADEQLEYKSSKVAASDAILASNMDTDSGNVIIRGMVASTVDIFDENICTVKYKVSEDAVSGSKLNVNLQVPLYLVGVDESGDDVYEIRDNIVLENLVLEIQ